MGYKKVFVSNDEGLVSEAVATLKIPNDADIRNNLDGWCYSKQRTNKAWVDSITITSNKATQEQIWNLNPNPSVNESARRAHSNSSASFFYFHNKWYTPIYQTMKVDTLWTDCTFLEAIKMLKILILDQ